MNLGKANDNREIRTEYLKIHGNCMEFKDIIIQLSNVSLVSINEIAPAKYPQWAFVSIVIGILLLCLQISAFVLIGTCGILLGGIVIFIRYNENEQAKQKSKLVIMTNSGISFSIIFNQQEFLKKVVGVLNEIISNPGHLADVTINIQDNTFTGDASIIRDYEEINY